MLKLKLLLEATNNILEVRRLQSPQEMSLYKDFVKRHYLETDPPNTSERFGVFRVLDGVMIGLIGYGAPSDPEVRLRLIDFSGNQLFQPEELHELKRLWAIDDDEVHNAESQAISLGNIEIAKVIPKAKVIVTFCDTRKHKAIVYQASNGIEISMPKSKLRRFFYPVGNPTTRKIARKKLEWYKANFLALRDLYNKGGYAQASNPQQIHQFSTVAIPE